MTIQRRLTGRIILFVAMASLLFAASTPASQRTWTSVREAKWKAPLLDVYFVDDQHGWIVGGESTILHTADGGKTWNDQPSQPLPFKMDLRKVRFINARMGWIVGDNGTILKYS